MAGVTRCRRSGAGTRRTCRRPRRSIGRCAAPRRPRSSRQRCRRSGVSGSLWCSSFGTESAALLKVMADVDPAIPVIFLDTGWLFEETLAYRDALIARLGLRDVRSIRPREETLSHAGSKSRAAGSPIPMPAAGSARWNRWRGRWRRSAPGSTGASAFRAASRADIPVVEHDGSRLKFNPFADASREEIAAIYAGAELPPHPLAARGYQSVGCMPCTSRTLRRTKTSAPAAGVAEPRRNAASIRSRLPRTMTLPRGKQRNAVSLT